MESATAIFLPENMRVKERTQVSPISKRIRSLQQHVESGRCVVDYLPEPRKTVLVHCEHFSCAAYLDEAGLWRGRDKHELITSRVIAWEEI